MSEPNDIQTGGSEADVQEQGGVDQPGGSPPAARGNGDGTGGSEADRQEQRTPALVDDAEGREIGDVGEAGIAGEGTGGSEADRLEQASDVRTDGEDAFPRGSAEDGPTT
ncbi:hypothetical protein FJV46_13900 [Arthrobacter agilis]|uniref:hypothetical protein n=1 Tax=Arthrobacter agilis TaxID=37921 RepID=UPI000B361876|nr:hypothetical protein [Arthrobacter agilis]OUM44807.1 hypothetical protein B8W74_02710 [Arthrobacter agilis]PPB47131.1 hypothetical protein CI784_03740 [Arthrobacter agilis]TPV22546.1 hypothetical protein FJV46_13900 [Arthrobacter agilis]VDR32370.1 Uncharacterised protein [Arthrobacter agilis]